MHNSVKLLKIFFSMISCNTEQGSSYLYLSISQFNKFVIKTFSEYATYFFNKASDRWLDCITNNNSPTSSNCVREYDIDPFNREMSGVFVTIFSVMVQIFSVNFIMLIKRGATYLSCYFAFVLG